MRILCFIDSLGSGGAQRQLVGLAKGFKERGHHVSILVYHDEPFFEKEVLESSITIYKILERNYLLRLLKIRRFIRNGNFDGVLSFLEVPNFICEISSLPRRNWKLVVGERNADPNILKSLKLRFYRLFHLLADYVVSNSNENIRLVKIANPLLNIGKCKVIYNLIEFSKWESDVKPYQTDSFNITILARHEFQKNLIGLINAVSILTSIERERLVINWYGGERLDNSKYEGIAKIKELNLEGIFNFYPDTTNVRDVMAHAHAIGLFSHYEGLPNTICEAMAMGKPIIVTRVSDLPSFIEDQKLICDSNEENSIKESISYLMSLTNEQLVKVGKSNKAKAIQLFNSNRIVESYLELLMN